MILITGATGFVGRAVVQTLSRRHRLRCIVRDASQSSFSHPGVEVLEGSLTDASFVSLALRDVTVVVHLASVLDPKDPQLHVVNVDGTKNLVTAARRSSVRHFIFLSTENVLYNCDDPYTASKRAAETLVKQFQKHLILREPIIYGPGDYRYIGKLISLLRRWPIVPIPGRGQWTFQPIFIDDLVAYIAEGIQRRITGVYTLAGKDAVSFLTLVSLLQRELHVSKPHIFIPLSLLRFIASCFTLIGLHPPLTSTQLTNLSSSRVISLRQQLSVFQHHPLSLREGIRRTLRAKSL